MVRQDKLLPVVRDHRSFKCLQPVMYYTIQEYLAHYHHERNHQGLDNQRIAPEPEHNDQGGAVVRRDRLGGLLRYYYREAA